MKTNFGLKLLFIENDFKMKLYCGLIFGLQHVSVENVFVLKPEFGMTILFKGSNFVITLGFRQKLLLVVL